jgi:hypothetical protein
MTKKVHNKPELDVLNTNVFIPNSEVFSGTYYLKGMKLFNTASHSSIGM